MLNIGAFYIPRPQLSSKLRLFCFPYAGGSINTFLQWETYLPDTIELVLIQPPGRGARISEKPHTCMQALVTDLLQHTSFLTEKPYVFFGHSLGGRVAFELAKQLQQSGFAPPENLIVSGSRAPHLSVAGHGLHQMPDPEFIEKLKQLNGTPIEVLNHSELMELLLPMLRADFQISDTYIAEHFKLACPIRVFHGKQDVDITMSHINAWKDLTQSSMELKIFDGDHFFIHQQRPQVLEEINLILSELTVLDYIERLGVFRPQEIHDVYHHNG